MMIRKGIGLFFFGGKKMEKIVFFGSGNVALPSLKVLTHSHPQLQVVTQSSKGLKKTTNPV